MGLSELAGEASALWHTVVTKEGKELTWMKECTDIARLDKEEHEVAQAVYNAVNTWISQDPEKNKAALKDFKIGFKMNHTDGNTYRVVQQKDNSLKITKWKTGSGKGQGGYKQSYIHLRVDQIKMCHFEDAFDTINNQEDNDNWDIVSVFDRLQEKAGPLFIMVNKKPYTPTTPTQASSGGNATSNEGDKEEDNQEESQG